MIESGIYGLLSATSTITSIVSTRIYPLVLPEDATLPALTYSIISQTDNPTFTTSGLKKARVQFDCWGKTYSDAVTLRAALLSALNGYQGTLPDGTIVQNTSLVVSTDLFEHDALYYRAMIEIYFLFN